jgi:predicted MFS family arabinose efflux permease
MSDAKKQQHERKGRVVALVIAGTAAFWVLGLFIGNKIGLSQRWLALIDLFALAGFVLAIAMIWQIWRARRDNEG